MTLTLTFPLIAMCSHECERRNKRNRRIGRKDEVGLYIVFDFIWVDPPPVTFRWHGIRWSDVKAFIAVAGKSLLIIVCWFDLIRLRCASWFLEHSRPPLYPLMHRSLPKASHLLLAQPMLPIRWPLLPQFRSLLLLPCQSLRPQHGPRC